MVSQRILEKDPYREREAENYEHPIPSREYILQYLEELGRPASPNHLITVFELESEIEREALQRRLRAMERDGQLMKTRRGSYGLVAKMDLLPGRVMAHPEGYGFFIPDQGGEDLFLSARQMRRVFHGDRVLVREIVPSRAKKREGMVVEVLERNTEEVVGRLWEENGVAFVVSDNKRITHDVLIPQEHLGKAKPGQVVVAEIIVQPEARRQPIGRITEILGEHGAPGLEIEIAIRSHGIPHRWPSGVLEEISHYQSFINQEDRQGRKDLRDLPFVTIDGVEAKDFDDAVYCERRPNGNWRLAVAIADVSYYVRPGSALDREAARRGNSVYFPEQVVPMLPEILSNHLCSLNPDVDRLALVCDMSLDTSGRLYRYQFFPAVICSHARLTYTQVAEWLSKEKKQFNKLEKKLFPYLLQLHELYHLLHQQRERRGALDFETVETRILFDSQRKIKQIVPVHRNVAHRMIEECMLMANVAAARFLLKHKMPALFRVHERPSGEKLEELRGFLRLLDLTLEGGDLPSNKQFARLTQAIQARSDAQLIQTVILKSMQQAIYSPDNIGHFGLAYPAYTHFTSPIRRYSDLLVHRQIYRIIAPQLAAKKQYTYEEMKQYGEQCSRTERRADEATRDVVDWLKCEFMQHRLGEEFIGSISHVTAFGLFVALQDVYVEGLVHVTALRNDYYRFDPVQHRLIGQRTGQIYRLGDTIRVKVARVDLNERLIDFVLAEDND